MRELTQIDSLAEHDCVTPRVERWNVLEPVSGRWSWLVVLTCCGRIATEPDAEVDADDPSTDMEQAA